MSSIATLLWLEFRKSSWLIVGVLLLFLLLMPLLASTPAVISPGGADWSSSSSDEQEDGATHYSWSSSQGWQGSFSWITGEVVEEENEDEGDEPAKARKEDQEGEDATAAASHGQGGALDILQFTIRPRQLAVPWVTACLATLLLLGFLVLHYRESESGEMCLLYQSPIASDVQIWTRFAYMVACVLVLYGATAIFYVLLQAFQGLEPLAPIAENASGHVQVDWINLGLVSLLAYVFPHAAFILLFCQVMNAYGLLNRRRLAGVVLFLAYAKLNLVILGWLVTRPAESAVWVRVANATFTGQPAGITDAIHPSRYLNLPVELLGIGLVLTLGMLVASGRIWRGVEWS